MSPSKATSQETKASEVGAGLAEAVSELCSPANIRELYSRLEIPGHKEHFQREAIYLHLWVMTHVCLEVFGEDPPLCDMILNSFHKNVYDEFNFRSALEPDQFTNGINQRYIAYNSTKNHGNAFLQFVPYVFLDLLNEPNRLLSERYQEERLLRQLPEGFSMAKINMTIWLVAFFSAITDLQKEIRQKYLVVLK